MITLEKAADICYGARSPARLPRPSITALVAQAVEGAMAAQRDAAGVTRTLNPYVAGTLADAWRAGYEHWTRTEAGTKGTGI